jgi:phytoene desaturase
MSSVLVVGAGLGGIATAVLLARRGYEVTVLEKNPGPGGRCDRLSKDGHRFDTGPTLFLMPEIVAQAFAGMGECLEEHLDLRRVDPSYQIHFRDGSTLVLSSDLNLMQTQLEAIEPGGFDGFLRYLEEGWRHYNLVFGHIAGRSFASAMEYFTPRNLLLIVQLRALARHYTNLSRYFKDQRLRMGFAFQDMYVGLSPYQAPATYSLLQYAELAGGVWFPMGGMFRLVEALVAIAEKNGVRFLYNAPVIQIAVNGRQATGVALADGHMMAADLVVANADLPYVYRHLLPDDGTVVRLERKQYTSSTITFCWGLDRRYPDVEAHNLFLARDFSHSLDQVFRQRTLPDDPSFYVHAPARIDPSLAPAGQDTLTVVVPVGHIDPDAPQDWVALTQRARSLVLERLAKVGIAGVQKHLKFEQVLTPADWQKRYSLTRGASFGLSHTFWQMGYLRPQNRHARYRNLYFVGASTHPGAGLPTVLLSARFAVERILEGES